jgi:hypothetical protein
MKKAWRNFFGSFDENIRSFSPTVDVLAQEGGGAQVLDLFGSIAQDFSSNSNVTVVEGQSDGSVLGIEEILREFSSKTDVASEGSAEVPVFNPVVDFGDYFVSTSNPTEQCCLSASIHTPRPTNHIVPIADVSALVKREKTCHYVIPGVETFEEVKAKLDFYNLFVTLVMQKDEVQNVSASIHAVKLHATEVVDASKTVLSAAMGERYGKVPSKVPVTPMEKELLIPNVVQNERLVFTPSLFSTTNVSLFQVPDVSKPLRFPSASVNTPNPHPVAPSAPLKKREIPRTEAFMHQCGLAVQRFVSLPFLRILVTDFAPRNLLYPNQESHALWMPLFPRCSQPPSKGPNAPRTGAPMPQSGLAVQRFIYLSSLLPYE